MKRIERLFFAVLAAAVAAFGTENGVSVYPIGADTVTPGVMPPSGQTIFLEFTNFYQANAMMDGSGHNAVPGFHLRVGAIAPKIVHNWGAHVLGGNLVSSVALPVVYEHLTLPTGSFQKTGLSNPDIGLLSVAYAKPAWRWWYGADLFTPGAPYHANDLLNPGNHNFALAPNGAFTWLPRRGRTQVSSKVLYIVNFRNPASGYHTGRELVWEYAAMHSITPRLSMGLNGYEYHQTSDDRQNGLVVGDGNRGQVLAAGPQVQYRAGKTELILKYQREMLVENRTKGNSFWFMLGVPLWHVEN